MEPRREQNWAWKRGGEGGISPAATPTPRDSPVPRAAASGGCCKVWAMLQTARQGMAGNLVLKWRSFLGSWELAGSPLQSQCTNPGPNYVLSGTLPSPAVMHWHVNKKHSAGQRILAASCGHKILYNVGIHPVATVTEEVPLIFLICYQKRTWSRVCDILRCSESRITANIVILIRI